MFISILNTLEFITNLVTEHGLLTGIIVSVVFVTVMVIKTISTKDTLSFIKGIFSSKKTTPVKVRESDIINHEIFNLIDFWVYSKIPTLNLRTEFRNVVFRKYLHIYFRSYKDILHVYVNAAEYKKLDNSELRKDLLKLITDIVFDYESEMMKDGLPPVIIGKMKEKNNEAIKLTIELINSICDSDFYNSERNLLKMYSFLNIVLSILENTLSHCEEVSQNINGELRGMTFNGVTES